MRVNGEFELDLDDLASELDLDSRIESALDDLDLDDRVERAVEDNVDWYDRVTDVLGDIRLGDYIDMDEVADSLDLHGRAEDAIRDHDLVNTDEAREIAEEAFAEAGFVREEAVQGMIDNALQDFQDRLIRALGGVTADETDRAIKAARTEALEAAEAAQAVEAAQTLTEPETPAEGRTEAPAETQPNGTNTITF